jgi:tripartite-type tricarboxylate transporter receptor subunit TctC
MLSGQIDLAFEPTSVLIAHIEDGKVRGVATTGKTRSAQLPDLPTMVESGYPEFVSVSWSGLVAPAGTPAAIVAKLNAALNDSLNAADTKATLAKLGADPRGGSPQDFAALIAEETPRWAAVVKAAGVRID